MVSFPFIAVVIKNEVNPFSNCNVRSFTLPINLISLPARMKIHLEKYKIRFATASAGIHTFFFHGYFIQILYRKQSK